MLLVAIALLIGFILGIIPWVPRKVINLKNILINGGVLLLVFGMGVRIGSDSTIIANLQSIGFRAFLLALFPALGGALGAFFAERLLRKTIREEETQ